MRAKPVTQHVFRIPLGMVNAFLIVLPEGLTLVDAGMRKSYPRIAEAISDLGRRPEDVNDIVVTHMHADHTGALAEARAATGARVWMHPDDASLVRGGESWRPVKAAPGSLLGGLFLLFGGKGGRPIATVPVDRETTGGEVIPVAMVAPTTSGAAAAASAGAATAPAAEAPATAATAEAPATAATTEAAPSGGLLPIWTPGHTAGHLVYLWPHDGGVLFVGDAARNSLRLKASPIYEDYERGIRSLQALAALDFEVACFSHGKPIVGGAAAAFARKWGTP